MCKRRLGAGLSTAVLISAMLAVIGPVPTAAATNASTERLWGPDRYATAAEIAQVYVSEAGSVDTVIVVGGLGFADALAATPLARVLHAPILLTTPEKLAAPAREFIGGLSLSKVVIIGGPEAVSFATETELAALTGVVPQRHAGANSHATVAAAARAMGRERVGDYCGDGRRTALLATSSTFADALALSPLAYAGPHPVLLTEPEALSDEVREVLVEFGIAQVIIAGGTAAVSQQVEDTLRDDLGVRIVRLWGADRFETAVEIAEALTPGCFGTDQFGLADAWNFPDALVAGPLLGHRKSPLLLAAPDGGTSTHRYLEGPSPHPDTVKVTVLGGPAAVSESSVRAALVALEPSAAPTSETCPIDDAPTHATSAGRNVQFPPSGANPGGDVAPGLIVVEGRGFGHGNGLSQWGAFGYATEYGCNGDQIALHYYGNTRLVDADSSEITVHLARNARKDMVVTSGAPFSVASQSFAAGETARVSVRDNAFAVHRTTGCEPEGDVEMAAGITGSVGRNGDRYVEVLPANDDPAADDLVQMLTMIYCSSGRGGSENMRIAYRGVLGIVKQSGRAYSFNRLPLEQYLRGVVPQESRPEWGAAQGPAGTGLAALEAQAIAARTYALYWSDYQVGRGRFTDICDWPNCQLYNGAADGRGRVLQANDFGAKLAHSNEAIRNTAGEALVDAAGDYAFTEFSSASGGWTAGPPASTFPAVQDLGDAVYAERGNGGHAWTLSLRRVDIERAFAPLFRSAGKELGQLVSIDVVERNGYGEWGGRVRALRVVGTSGEHTFSFDRWARDPFRRAFPALVLSDWYRFPQFDGGQSPREPAPSIAEAPLWVLKADGTVGAYGLARHYGDASELELDADFVDIAATSTGKGYWLVTESGSVHAYGDARHHGDASGTDFAGDVVAIAAHRTGAGYWLATSGGDVLHFGDAPDHGDAADVSGAAVIVDIEATPSGDGYWLLGADGNVAALGGASDLGGAEMVAVAMAATPDGEGYWLLSSATEIAAFGSASWLGSRGNEPNRLNSVSMVSSGTGDGYWLVWTDGTSFNYGDAPDYRTSLAGPGVVAAESVQ